MAAVNASEEQFFHTNVQGLWNVLDAAATAGVRRTVVCSSVAAYNISRENPPRSLPVDVDHPLAPVTAYGLSKQVGEVVAKSFAQAGSMQLCCLRPALVMQANIAYGRRSQDGRERRRASAAGRVRCFLAATVRINCRLARLRRPGRRRALLPRRPGERYRRL